MNIHLLRIIYWTPKKFKNWHPQELWQCHLEGNLDHLGKLARNGSCIWDYVVGLHMIIWNALHVRNFVFTHHGVWKQVAKVWRNSPYLTTMKAIMIINPQWLEKRVFIFLQVVWFLLLVMYVQVVVDSLNKWFLD